MAEIQDDAGLVVRSRTYSWDDPMPSVEARRRLSGIEYLRGFLNGTFPPAPIAQTMGMRFVEVEGGRAVFEGEPAEYHYNPIGVVHGGLAAALLDSAMGCAVHSTLPVDVGYTTIEIKVNYLRALTCETGAVRAEGKIIKVGGRVAIAEGRITDAAGNLYAHGTTTCLILRQAQSPVS
jgi:uncharacterized protein (TIGR00369 family)